MHMSAVYPLERLLSGGFKLSPGSRSFCEALLAHGEVLAVRLSYAPEILLWLVTSPAQARILRTHQVGTMILTLAEARDFLGALGDPCPLTLMEVAERFASAPPDPRPEPGDGGDDSYV